MAGGFLEVVLDLGSPFPFQGLWLFLSFLS